MSIEGTNSTTGPGVARFTVPGGSIARGGRSGPAGTSFAEILRDSIREVTELQNQADAAIRELAPGRTGPVDEVLHRLEKADVAFRTLLTVRNELTAAHEEIRGLRV